MGACELARSPFHRYPKSVIDTTRLSSQGLRSEISERNLRRTSGRGADVGFSRTPTLVYAEDQAGGHGNFLPASYRRILADPAWSRRLQKSYTGGARLPRADDRWRGELECAASSDALLMNVFCYPGVLRRSALCALLGVDVGTRPEFGVRAELPMKRGEIDRTELDMCLGDLTAEAKLTESGFGYASRDRLLRYTGVEDIFDLELLPRGGRGYGGYQLVRGILAAVQRDAPYLVLIDRRRHDLEEQCFRVLNAVQRSEVRHRLRLRTWQELSATLPLTLQILLAERFGIIAA